MPQEVDDIRESVVLITSASTGNKKFGTGFSIRCEPDETWIVTCAHVVEDVGGINNVLVNTRPVTKLALGEPQEVDLAVLRVQGLTVPPLKLGLSGSKEMACRIPGCTDFDSGRRKRESLEAILGSQVDFSKGGDKWVKAWALQISGDTPLEGGYSGSPVLCALTRTVVAVVSHKAGQGGYAVSLDHLHDIWSDMPAGLLGVQPLASGGWLAPEQRRFLERLFQQPPVPDSQLRAWCHQAIPPDDPHTISADANGLDLLEWLIRKGPLPGGQAPLLTVLQQLLPLIADTDARHRLQQAMEQVARHFGIAAIQPPALATTTGSPTLMLEFSLPAPGKQWDVQGRLFYSAEKIFGVYARTTREGTALSVEDVEEQAALVEDLRKILVERGVAPDGVIIEFILPQELWSQAVEHWADDYGEPLGIEFPVVVRPSERQRNPALQLRWQQYWSFCRAGAFPDSLWLFEKFEERWQRQVRGKLQQGVCIALGFVPDVLAPLRQNAVLYLLHTGAPVIIWFRQEGGLAEFVQELPELLNKARSLPDLPDIIYTLRRHLWEAQREQAACYHLTLLWDDPDRRLPKPEKDDEFYQGPGV